MKKAIAFGVALVVGLTSIATAKQNENDLSIYRKKYAKPISQWEKPKIDKSVKGWEEFAPLPKQAKFPKDNPFLPIKAFLGRTLFNEPRLSKSGQFSCESCHHRELASSDGVPRSLGHNGLLGRRNAPSTQMSGFFPELFWDGRAKSLEEQALGPITDPTEMANTLENAENAIKNAPEYYALFVSSFGDDEIKKVWAQWYPKIFTQDSQSAVMSLAQRNANVRIVPNLQDIQYTINLPNATPRMQEDIKNQIDEIFKSKAFNTLLGEKNTTENLADIVSQIPKDEIEKAKKLITIENIAKAIATFERGPNIMGARNTRFNRFLNGDYTALSDKELYGMDIFRNKGACMNCHYGAILSDKKFHNIGLDFYGREGQDLGRYEVTKKRADVGAFKTPSLINVSKTAPYMHNGISPNLIGVIQLFNAGVPVPVAENVKKDKLLPQKSHLIKPLNLSVEEIEALEAFLRAL